MPDIRGEITRILGELLSNVEDSDKTGKLQIDEYHISLATDSLLALMEPEVDKCPECKGKTYIYLDKLNKYL